mgnify:CR=1 FL=1
MKLLNRTALLTALLLAAPLSPLAARLRLAARTVGDAMDRVELVEGVIDDAPEGPFDAATCLLTLHFSHLLASGGSCNGVLFCLLVVFCPLLFGAAAAHLSQPRIDR